MKTVLYTLAFALLSAMTITACTEEEVTPTQVQSSNGGGGVSSDRIY
jgi:hypothetical protein